MFVYFTFVSSVTNLTYSKQLVFIICLTLSVLEIRKNKNKKVQQDFELARPSVDLFVWFIVPLLYWLTIKFVTDFVLTGPLV